MLEQGIKGAAVVSEEAVRLSEEFEARGFAIPPESIRRRLCESDVIAEVCQNNRVVVDRWVEIATRRPGDLEDHTWLVFCSQSTEPGSAVNRNYVAL